MLIYVMQIDTSKQYPLRPGRMQILFDNQSPLFFVTFNTYIRKQLPANEAIHNSFIDFCTKSPDYGIVVGTYVIMPDHIRFFAGLIVTASG